MEVGLLDLDRCLTGRGCSKASWRGGVERDIMMFVCWSVGSEFMPPLMFAWMLVGFFDKKVASV